MEDTDDRARARYFYEAAIRDFERTTRRATEQLAAGALPGRDGLQKQLDAHQSLENARLWLILKSGGGPH